MEANKFTQDVLNYVNSKLSLFDMIGESRVEALADVCKDYLKVTTDDAGHFKEFKELSDEEHAQAFGDCILLKVIGDDIVRSCSNQKGGTDE